MKRLSSITSVPLAILGLAFALISVWTCAIMMIVNYGLGAVPLSVVVMSIAATAFGIHRLRATKNVWLDKDALVVQSWGTRERIPLANVLTVTEHGWGNPREIRVQLKEPSALGREFTFTAPTGTSSVGENTMVRHLRQLVRRHIGHRPRGGDEE